MEKAKYPKGIRRPYLSEVIKVSAHDLGRLVDGLHAGTTGHLKTLLEVRFSGVVKDEPGPPFWVFRVRPNQQGFHPGSGSLPLRTVGPWLDRPFPVGFP